MRRRKSSFDLAQSDWICRLGLARPQGSWSQLVKTAKRAVVAVMSDVFSQDLLEMTTTQDDEPIGARSPDCPRIVQQMRPKNTKAGPVGQSMMIGK